MLENWHPAEGTEAPGIKQDFSHWDGNLTVDSRLALIYELWSARLSSKLSAKVFPSLASIRVL